MKLLRMQPSLLVGVMLSIVLMASSLDARESDEPPNQGRPVTLQEIADFASKFCGDFWREGEEIKIGISGEAEAQLKGFLSKFVKMGISGDVEFDISKHIGPLRKDLAKELKDIRDCKIILWKDLNRILISPPQGITVNLQHSKRTVEISGALITNGEKFEIVADVLLANNAKILIAQNRSKPPRAENGRNGAPGTNGAEDSASSGGHGGDGVAGTDGNPSDDVEPITIQAATFSGVLIIDSSGLDGQDGGNGGHGGNGGRGGSGRDGATSVIECRRGPTSGGSGGNAGRGSDAGNGGDAGDAGDVMITIGELQKGKIVVKSQGGRGGQPGVPGRAGTPGEGGPRGSAPGLCSAGGAGTGSPGVGNRDGLVGNPGNNGQDGLIRVVVGDQEMQRTGSFVFPN